MNQPENTVRPTARQLVDAALERLPYVPLDGQLCLLAALTQFAVSHGPRDVFMLNGYAGTGKTSVVGGVIGAMESFGMKTVILAPTGRAAKVASLLSSHPASTIHKRIYRGNSANPAEAHYFLAQNRDVNTLFVVDEASLISDTLSPGHVGSLLDHLARHIYSAPGCAMVLVGDVAQLPPVGQVSSPAMSRDRIAALGLNPICASLDVPVRQSAESGILYNATVIRQALFAGTKPEDFAIHVKGFPDVTVISSADLADSLAESWGAVGQEETLIVTRSNKRANNFNHAIRNLVMGADEPLQRGDRVVIAKNDYFWSRQNELKSFIANGDTAEVTWVGRTEKVYGRYFTDVELYFASDNVTVGAKIMLRSLAAEGPSIPTAEMERFYQRVMAEKEGSLTQKMKFVSEDPYFNALQVKYAYCVTCHKAQGGQWRHVYVDTGMIPPDALDSDFYRWLYTAVTRATDRLFFINPTVKVN